MEGRRVNSVSHKDHPTLFAKENRDKAVQLPPGPEKDALLKKARQADTASKIDEWANSRGLQPPK